MAAARGAPVGGFSGASCSPALQRLSCRGPWLDSFLFLSTMGSGNRGGDTQTRWCISLTSAPFPSSHQATRWRGRNFRAG